MNNCLVKYVIDGDFMMFWYFYFLMGVVCYFYEFVIDLGEFYEVIGFGYFVR